MAVTNTHFLFNSFNSLSALIEEDPKRAEQFLNEMSKVYRYLLRDDEDKMVPLHCEIKFIKSYYYLLKTRHGDGIEIDIKVEDQYLDYELPPLTLQLVIENSMKHNTISKVSPLRFGITTIDTGRLLITNNRQPKAISTTAVNGLSSIKNKYKLLNQPDVIIREDENDFSVVVSLASPYIPWRGFT